MIPARQLQSSVLPGARASAPSGVAASSRALTALLTLLYMALFHLIYSVQISPAFAYMGYTLNPSISLGQWAVTALFAVLPLLFLRLDGARPSNFIILLLYLLVYVPAQYMFTALDLTLHHVLLNRMVLLMGLAAMTAVSARPMAVGFDRPVSAGVFRAVLALLFASLFLGVASQFGFGLNLVGLFDVYDIRSEYKDEVGEAGRAFAYAVPYLGIVSAFMVGYGLIKRFFPFTLLGLFAAVHLWDHGAEKYAVLAAAADWCGRAVLAEPAQNGPELRAAADPICGSGLCVRSLEQRYPGV
ncbi:hypothetical protein [Deinococcus radiophilus]|uniref:hypothetical protein n=1 Tax=Deinococcus radiophilus TaxID=32062 RepID=UPI00361C9AA8